MANASCNFLSCAGLTSSDLLDAGGIITLLMTCFGLLAVVLYTLPTMTRSLFLLECSQDGSMVNGCLTHGWQLLVFLSVMAFGSYTALSTRDKVSRYASLTLTYTLTGVPLFLALVLFGLRRLQIGKRASASFTRLAKAPRVWTMHQVPRMCFRVAVAVLGSMVVSYFIMFADDFTSTVDHTFSAYATVILMANVASIVAFVTTFHSHHITWSSMLNALDVMVKPPPTAPAQAAATAGGGISDTTAGGGPKAVWLGDTRVRVAKLANIRADAALVLSYVTTAGLFAWAYHAAAGEQSTRLTIVALVTLIAPDVFLCMACGVKYPITPLEIIGISVANRLGIAIVTPTYVPMLSAASLVVFGALAARVLGIGSTPIQSYEDAMWRWHVLRNRPDRRNIYGGSLHLAWFFVVFSWATAVWLTPSFSGLPGLDVFGVIVVTNQRPLIVQATAYSVIALLVAHWWRRNLYMRRARIRPPEGSTQRQMCFRQLAVFLGPFRVCCRSRGVACARVLEFLTLLTAIVVASVVTEAPFFKVINVMLYTMLLFGYPALRILRYYSNATSLSWSYGVAFVVGTLAVAQSAWVSYQSVVGDTESNVARSLCFAGVGFMTLLGAAATYKPGVMRRGLPNCRCEYKPALVTFWCLLAASLTFFFFSAFYAAKNYTDGFDFVVFYLTFPGLEIALYHVIMVYMWYHNDFRVTKSDDVMSLVKFWLSPLGYSLMAMWALVLSAAALLFTEQYSKFLSEDSADLVGVFIIIALSLETVSLFTLSAVYAKQFDLLMPFGVVKILMAIGFVLSVAAANAGLVLTHAAWGDYLGFNMTALAAVMFVSSDKELLFQRRPGKFVVFGSGGLPFPVLLVDEASQTIKDLSPSLARMIVSLVLVIVWTAVGTVATTTQSNWVYPATLGIVCAVLSIMLMLWRSTSSTKFAAAVARLPPRTLQALLHETCPRDLQTGLRFAPRLPAPKWVSATLLSQESKAAPTSSRTAAMRAQADKLDEKQANEAADRRARVDKFVASVWAEEIQGHGTPETEDAAKKQLEEDTRRQLFTVWLVRFVAAAVVKHEQEEVATRLFLTRTLTAYLKQDAERVPAPGSSMATPLRQPEWSVLDLSPWLVERKLNELSTKLRKETGMESLGGLRHRLPDPIPRLRSEMRVTLPPPYTHDPGEAVLKPRQPLPFAQADAGYSKYGSLYDRVHTSLKAKFSLSHLEEVLPSATSAVSWGVIKAAGRFLRAAGRQRTTSLSAPAEGGSPSPHTCTSTQFQFVKQSSRLEDCWLISALNALVGENTPHVARTLVRPVEGEAVEGATPAVPQFAVHLYDARRPHLPRTVPLYVPNGVPKGPGDGLLYATTDGPTVGQWPLLVEKAFVVLESQESAVGDDPYRSLSMGFADESLRRLTGGVVTKYRTKAQQDDTLLESLLTYQRHGGFVVATTDCPRLVTRLGGSMQDQHAFTLRHIWELKVSNGDTEELHVLVEMLDPYGEHPKDASGSGLMTFPDGTTSWLPRSPLWDTRLGTNMKQALGGVDPAEAGDRGIFFVPWSMFHMCFTHVYGVHVLHADFMHNPEVSWHIGVAEVSGQQLEPYLTTSITASTSQRHLQPVHSFELSPVFAVDSRSSTPVVVAVEFLPAGSDVASALAGLVSVKVSICNLPSGTAGADQVVSRTLVDNRDMKSGWTLQCHTGSTPVTSQFCVRIEFTWTDDRFPMSDPASRMLLWVAHTATQPSHVTLRASRHAPPPPHVPRKTRFPLLAAWFPCTRHCFAACTPQDHVAVHRGHFVDSSVLYDEGALSSLREGGHVGEVKLEVNPLATAGAGAPARLGAVPQPHMSRFEVESP